MTQDEIARLREIENRDKLNNHELSDEQELFLLSLAYKQDAEIIMLRAALNGILHEKNLAMQRHWDSTEKMGNIAFKALAEGDDK